MKNTKSNINARLYTCPVCGHRLVDRCREHVPTTDLLVRRAMLGTLNHHPGYTSRLSA